MKIIASFSRFFAGLHDGATSDDNSTDSAPIVDDSCSANDDRQSGVNIFRSCILVIRLCDEYNGFNIDGGTPIKHNYAAFLQSNDSSIRRRYLVRCFDKWKIDDVTMGE